MSAGKRSRPCHALSLCDSLLSSPVQLAAACAGKLYCVTGATGFIGKTLLCLSAAGALRPGPHRQSVCLYAAGHLVQQLLAAGARVRGALCGESDACISAYTATPPSHSLTHTHPRTGTVRSLANEARLSHLRVMPHAAEHLELVEADLLAEGCMTLTSAARSFGLLTRALWCVQAASTRPCAM